MTIFISKWLQVMLPGYKNKLHLKLTSVCYIINIMFLTLSIAIRVTICVFIGLGFCLYSVELQSEYYLQGCMTVLIILTYSA